MNGQCLELMLCKQGRSKSTKYWLTSLYKNWISFVRNLPGANTDWGIEEKQTIIGSIFTEKLQFDGKKVRTAFFNEALFHLISIEKGCSIIKKGQLNKNIKLSFKALLVDSRSNRFWKDLKKFREWKSHPIWVAFVIIFLMFSLSLLYQLLFYCCIIV